MRMEREKNEGCLAKALPHEMVFTLLGRDPIAAQTVRFWVARRIETGKNLSSDPEIREALDAANAMDAERAAIRAELGK